MIRRIIQLPDTHHFFLFGARLTGKSTLLGEKFSSPDVLLYNLLHTDTLKRLTARPELFRAEVAAAAAQGSISHVIIDEVQKLPPLLDEVHALIEGHKALTFILSGSSARKLKRAHANLLAGRAWTCNLYPLVFAEVSERFDLIGSLQYGMLPEVYLENDVFAKCETLRSYVNTYIKEEVEIDAQIRNMGGFLRFLPMAAAQNGETVNHSNIARETGVKNTVVKGYYQILEEMLLGYYVLPYARSIRHRLARHPKFYFFDTGVVRALTNTLQAGLEEATENFGRAFEHFIMNEIRAMNDYFRRDWVISFYRTEAGAEVDCIIETPGGRTIAVEIKATISPSSTHCRGLRSFGEVVPQAELLLFCRCPRPAQIGKVLALPWQDGLERLAGV